MPKASRRQRGGREGLSGREVEEEVEEETGPRERSLEPGDVTPAPAFGPRCPARAPGPRESRPGPGRLRARASAPRTVYAARAGARWFPRGPGEEGKRGGGVLSRGGQRLEVGGVQSLEGASPKPEMRVLPDTGAIRKLESSLAPGPPL